MESYLPSGGFQLPFQRRLSRLYNDTKKSSDFVKEPVQNAEDPEIKALHRKLRIQKDRLVSWGLEWSDPSQSQSAEVLIDTSLSKAGLSEVVGSIMSTIKDILAEAEPLWQSSKRLVGERESEKSSGEKRHPMVPWDKGRFEDLVRDLTTSIDTLYDLSRTRSSAATSQAGLYKSGGSTEDLRAFESTRMQTPKQIDPKTLTNLRSMQAEPMSEGLAEENRPREIVFMTKQAYAEIAHQSGRQPYSPLLLEYANFDPVYSATGIMPSMARFEKLSAGLQTEPQRSPGSWSGLPRLLGYFEDMEQSRLGLVYQFPPTFNPVSFENLTQNPLYSLCSLSELLARPDFEPKLEAKFRLASNLANTVFDMHARGIPHGNLIDTNISFCNAVGNDPAMNTADVDIRRPLVSSFDLFPDSPFQDISSASFSLYRHPLDPRVTSQPGIHANADSRVFDLYSLSMLLLSIGLWTRLELLVPHAASTEIPSAVLDQLAIRCGTLYAKAVQVCWTAVEKELSGQGAGEQLLSRVQVKASRYLEACCILDGVSGLEERLSDDLGEPRPIPVPVLAPAQAQPSTAGSSKGKESIGEPRKLAKSAAELQPIHEQLQRERGPPAGFTQTTPVVIENFPLPEEKAPVKPRPEKKAKTRLYPHVPLPADAVEQWNSFLMPQVNQALRHFYRKNLESVEISLESIGESARETRPTVLVVCTSVSKVRSILKKQLGSLFDGTSTPGFALKVCRGQVLRSRKSNGLDAANGEFQERPQNGASIGAWIGDRHLPPVSFGGLVLVDDKPYGMTVHHMLDDPDADQTTATAEQCQQIMRSSAAAQEMSDLNQSLASWYADLQAESSADSSSEDDYACEFSDSESEAYSESAATSQYSGDDERKGGGEGEEEDDEDKDEEDEHDVDTQYGDPGDIPGIELGCGEEYVVTQPALDDVPEGFYPSQETADEDHLDTFSLGEIHASSGIRRRTDDKGLIHEIDWALFEFKDGRLPDLNSIPRILTGKGSISAPLVPQGEAVLHPTTVAPSSALPGLEVQCIARTSGLQSGKILPIITSVKIYGRLSPSHTYQVSGTPSLHRGGGRGGAAAAAAGAGEPSGAGDKNKNTKSSPPRPLGIPGDSGAWIVEREHGRLCGHVLAWSERKRVAYFCPMDVLLLDIAETLEAAEVRLPGGEAIVNLMTPNDERRGPAAAAEEADKDDIDSHPPTPKQHQQQHHHHPQQYAAALHTPKHDSWATRRISRTDEGFVEDDVSSVGTQDYTSPPEVSQAVSVPLRSAGGGGGRVPSLRFRDSGVDEDQPPLQPPPQPSEFKDMSTRLSERMQRVGSIGRASGVSGRMEGLKIEGGGGESGGVDGRGL